MINKDNTITLTRKNHLLLLFIATFNGVIIGVAGMYIEMQVFMGPKNQSGFEKINKETGPTGMTYEQKMNKQTEDSFAAIKKNVQSTGE